MIGGIAAARLASAFYWRRLGIPIRWEMPDAESFAILRRIVGKMGAGYFIQGVLILSLSADVMIVAWLGGTSAVTEFVLVWKVAEVLIQLLWRVPEMLTPKLVLMDARGDHDLLRATYARISRLTNLLPLIAGVAYAILGRTIVSLWVGASNVPAGFLPFVAAGGAIFFSASARLPAIYAYATVRLRQLNAVAGLELVGKLAIGVLLFRKIGYVAIPLATCAVHCAGIALAYRRLGPRR
jgi:hypothetical protein